MNNHSDRVRVRDIETLADDWAVLKKTTLDYQRGDGTWQTLTRETYDRGNGAAILLYNWERQTVILTQQFRYMVFVNGHSGYLIEACAGLLDDRSPPEAIRRETAEETGYTVQNPRKIMELFMSPGSVTEKLFFFVAEYAVPLDRGQGVGVAADGEDIRVIEVSFGEALQMIERGEIVDGKTVTLLQWAVLQGLFA